MMLNFFISRCLPSRSLFQKEMPQLTLDNIINVTSMSSSFTSSMSVSIGDSNKSSETIIPVSLDDKIRLLAVRHCAAGSGLGDGEGLGTLVNIDDECTFQLSLLDNIENSFCVYVESSNSYGFGSTYHEARQAALTKNSNLLFGMVGNKWRAMDDFFDYSTPNPKSYAGESFKLSLSPEDPFFKKFHEAMTPYIEREIINSFLYVGRFMTMFTEIGDNIFLPQNKLSNVSINDFSAALHHYVENTEYIFKYKDYFPTEFNAFREVLFYCLTRENK